MITGKNNVQSNEALFIEAYETAFPKVASFVKKMGGTLEEAKDIFQDALVIYYEKREDARAQQSVPYIAGIARHLWYKKYRENRSQRSLNVLPDLVMPEEEPKVSASLFRYIENSGKKCLELLRSFYYDKLPMKDLAEKFGFSGERSATTQKYKCLEKIRDTLKERALTKEHFYE